MSLPTGAAKRLELARESPGLPPDPGLTGEAHEDDPGGPISPGWIPDDLITYTQEVWERFLGRPVPKEEAIEMLVNARRVAEVLCKAASALEEKQP